MYRLLLVALVLVAACAGEPAPTAPDSTSSAAIPQNWVIDVTPATDADLRHASGMRYPLQLGNVWKHRAHVTMVTIPDEGDPDELEIIRVTKSEISGASQYFGRCYIVEERTITEDIGDGEPFVQIVNYRQDRAGLYEVADASVAPVDAAARRSENAFALELRKQRQPGAWAKALTATQNRVQPLYAMRYGRGGVLEGELTRLKYPLHRKQEWVVIDDSFTMTATVERRVVLDLPVGRTPAWKVRMESTFFGPDDVVHFFYGRDGYLGWQLSLVSEVTDELGERIGTVLFTDEEYLEELSIDRRGEVPCGPARRGDKPRDGTEYE